MLKELERFVDTMLGAAAQLPRHRGYEVATGCAAVFRRVIADGLGRDLDEAEQRLFESQQLELIRVAGDWDESSVTGEVVMRWNFPGPRFTMPPPTLWQDRVFKATFTNPATWSYRNIDDTTTKISLCWKRDRAYAVVQEIRASFASVDDLQPEGQVYSVKLLMVSKFGSVLLRLVMQELSNKMDAGHLWWDSAWSKFVALAGMVTSPTWTTGEVRGNYMDGSMLRMFNASGERWEELIRLFAPTACRYPGVGARWLPGSFPAPARRGLCVFWDVDNTHLIFVVGKRDTPLHYQIGFVAKSRAERDGVCGWG
jgi:hypothetical protein